MLKRPSYHFLHFTRKEKNGTIFILFIICLLTITPFIYSLIIKEKIAESGELKNELSSLKLKPDSNKIIYSKKYDERPAHNFYKPYAKNNYNKPSKIFLFDFNPNTLPAEGWEKLGVNDRTISTIQNYLSKGGKFRQPDDIKKIWGLHDDQVKIMLPYVKIPATETGAASYPAEKKKEYPRKETAIININQCDSFGLVSLPGIGPGYARRIIKFRDKLGGFYSAEQVSETFGLPDSTFQKIKSYLRVSVENIKKININTATLDELKEHPYIRYQLANAIIGYRTQHGTFPGVDNIKKIMMVTDSIFLKFSPFLTEQ